MFDSRIIRRLAGFLGLVLLLVFLNMAAASWLLWRGYDTLADALFSGQWPIESGLVEIEASAAASDQPPGAPFRMRLARAGGRGGLEVEVPGQDLSPFRAWGNESTLHVSAAGGKAHFFATGGDYSEIGSALRAASAARPQIGWKQRILAIVAARPFVTGLKRVDGTLSWRVSLSVGTLWTGGPLGVREANIAVGDWRGRLVCRQEAGLPDFFPEVRTAGVMEVSRHPGPSKTEAETEGASSELQAEFFGFTRDPKMGNPEGGQQVPGEELAAGLAEAIRILTWRFAPAKPEPDEIRRAGQGWMEIRQGHRQMFLSGTPYEVGWQHGSLAPEEIRRVARRLVYGVGLLYSLKQKEWFPQAARDLVERQRRFIAPATFEEMKGVAAGAGLPLGLIQAANIFPEFFHCSGVAVMGKASAGGELLHARVLDYMTEIGLQDEAVVMAVEQPGLLRFVTVGYLGFIGSVTGMNEKQVAIGEMGGAGQGNWDGMPMSFLIREALETCSTLEEVERFMRESPRTCEYFYLISDGKGPSALGVAATPERFETFGPGVWHERLTQPVEDAVLLSGAGRYEKLVQRVQGQYGAIDRDGLIEIIKRPVAMRSNLHNVVFQPQSLQLSVADAVRNGLACDQPYRTYSWNDLFSTVPAP